MYDISAILADTAAHGFHFEMSPVSTDSGETDLGQIPVLVIDDLEAFEVSFPGVILRLLNHPSSPRVQCQAIGRRLLKSARIPEGDRMAVMGPKMLNAILGVRTRTATVVTKQVYVLPDGTTTDDKEVALAAWEK